MTVAFLALRAHPGRRERRWVQDKALRCRGWGGAIEGPSLSLCCSRVFQERLVPSVLEGLLACP